MKNRRAPLAILAFAFLFGGGVAFALARGGRMPVGNPSAPDPSKPVSLDDYLGLWYEIGRYENAFERGLEGVTAEYRARPDGAIQIINTGRRGGVSGRVSTAMGRARVVAGSHNAKLKVSFFGPFFFGDYWVLDHANDYGWLIVGEPSGRYLWLLCRARDPSAETRAAIQACARKLGYDTDLFERRSNRLSSHAADAPARRPPIVCFGSEADVRIPRRKPDIRRGCRKSCPRHQRSHSVRPSIPVNPEQNDCE